MGCAMLGRLKDRIKAAPFKELLEYPRLGPSCFEINQTVPGYFMKTLLKRIQQQSPGCATPSGRGRSSLSHRMGEGRGEGPRCCSLSHGLRNKFRRSCRADWTSAAEIAV